MNAIHTRIAARWQQFTRGIQRARRARHALRELAQMGAIELRDIGISHAALATMAQRLDARGA
jgi:uncharacterized protein YjiS (DUF1127 family)